jgi:hypothetical protein
MSNEQITPDDCKQIVQATLIHPWQWHGRARNLAAFCNKHGIRPDAVTILENNSWSYPPTPSKWRFYSLLGGTTYRYQVWAVLA